MKSEERKKRKEEKFEKSYSNFYYIPMLPLPVGLQLKLVAAQLE